MERQATWKITASAAFLLLAAMLVFVSPAFASSSPVSGANVLSSTQVRLTFGAPLTAEEASALGLSISPSLAVQGRVLADGGNSLVLTTASQSNAVTYVVSVTAPGGASLGNALFIGTTLGPASTSVWQDDFNRPSGVLATDTPFGGGWYTKRVDAGNSLGLVSSPAFIGGSGDRACFSRVTNTDPNLDNASLYYKISGKDYYTSAYVYIPSGQNWAAGQAVGLLRLDQYYDTAHARLTAYTESPAGYSLRVDWKSTGNTYFSKLPGQGGVEPLVASGVSFDAWHWLQLHVKNSTATGAPGVVEAWVDGRLAFQQASYYVQTTSMGYAEFGIMHMVTTGPAATTITDQLRLGTSYQQPSLGGQLPPADTTPPSVSLTAPTNGATVPAAIPMTATAGDDTGVQRVDFLVDGSVVGSDTSAPYELVTSQVAAGNHTLSATATDTSGNSASSQVITVTVAVSPPPAPAPTIAVASLGPDPWNPATGPLSLTFSTNVAGSLAVTFYPAGKASPLRTINVSVAAGNAVVRWDGLNKNQKPVPAGRYDVRAYFKDASGTKATPYPVAATFTLVR